MANTTTTRTKKKPLTVRVRMYRQGLGDCFLLRFPGRKGDFHMLIDCGVILGTEDAEQKMKDVVQDIQQETKGHLNLVVATHEHWDHLSGFIQAQELFKQNFSIDTVWLAWTEDPNNQLAKELRQDREDRLNALHMAVEQVPDQQYRQGIMEVLSFFGERLGATGTNNTKAALDYLAQRSDATVHYCRPKAKDSPLRLDGVEDVRIYVLGPPEDMKLIKRSNPTKTGHEVYEKFFNLTLEKSFFAATGHGSKESSYNIFETLCFPFDTYYQIPYSQTGEHGFFKMYYHRPGDEWRKIDREWLAVSGELAMALDSDTNNTSLALAIELGENGKVLLFPGDAQVGNWLSWESLSWTITDSAGQSHLVTANDLLNRTVLYKVGHHGSHNATLREKGLELMEHQDLVAMVPVNREMAQRKHWDMPFPPLFKRLIEKTRGRIILADADSLPDRTVLTEAEWATFKQATAITDLYIDYTISV